MSVTQIDDRHNDGALLDIAGRRIQARIEAAVDNAAQNGPPDAEQIVGDLIAFYDIGGDPDVPEIVVALARQQLGDLVRSEIEKRGRP